MTTLEDLYYGNIVPHEHSFKRRSAYSEVLSYVIRHQDSLILTLTVQQKEIFEKLKDCEDRKTFQCHSSYKTIGNAVGMSKNTVRKHVDGLTKKRLITTEPTSVYTQKGEKRNGNLLYTVRPIEDAVEYHY